MEQEQITKLNERFLTSTPQELLAYFLEQYGDKIALASSLGAEDQVLTEMIIGIHPATKIFTLDTGRLFPETYDLIDRTCRKYKFKMEVFFPNYKEIQQMVSDEGINLFFESVENRKRCCNLRKIEPLKRAFNGLDVWVCGLRSDQSVTRSEIKKIEWDDSNQLLKINPLADWTEDQVWEYIKEKKVPYNTLHDKGFPSIGCQPCTRAILEGEDVRAGRWWWENPDTKECGLHKK